MGYRDSDDSGFSRHGMNRDNDHHDPLQHQRAQRVGFDHPDLDRDEDLRTSHSIPGDTRGGRYEPYGGRRDGQGYQGASAWEGRNTGRDTGRDIGRDRYYQGGNSNYRNHDTGYGYGARSPDIGGYDPYEAEQRYRQQQYGGGGYGSAGYDGGYGRDDRDRTRLNRPDAWAREGYGNSSSSYDRDQGGGGYGYGYATQRGRSYGYGYDGRQDGDSGNYDRQQGDPQYRASSHRDQHDPDYSAWRQEQLRLLDEDYDSWRNERYQKFSDEFNTWRTSRSRNEGLRGSNQSGQSNQSTQPSTSASGKNLQGSASSNPSGSSGAGSGVAASGKAKD